MLDNVSSHILASAVCFSIIGFAYFVDRCHNLSKHEISEDDTPSLEFPTSQSVSSCPYPFPEVAQEQSDNTFGKCILDADEQPEPITDVVANDETISTPGYKRYATDYRHELWPSPRPVNFVKALVKGDHVEINGRLTHGKAIEILSSRAQMTPEQFLSTNPITYTKIFMPHQYNAAILLGQSIQRLEDTIKRHQYLATLRKYG